MTSFSRRLAMAFSVGAMICMVVGCGQPKPSPQIKALEDIVTGVPKLAELPLRNAEKVLALQALKIGEVTFEETDDPSLHGKVLGQDPAPGTEVRGGTPVDVKVYRYVSPER